MSNTILPHVLVCDTVGDGAAVGLPATGTPLLIRAARWTAGAAAGVATFTDAGGSVARCTLSIDAANRSDTMYFDPPLKLDGLKIIALPSGFLRIYCQP